jgi:hypothetical protein
MATIKSLLARGMASRSRAERCLDPESVGAALRRALTFCRIRFDVAHGTQTAPLSSPLEHEYVDIRKKLASPPPEGD